MLEGKAAPKAGAGVEMCLFIQALLLAMVVQVDLIMPPMNTPGVDGMNGNNSGGGGGGGGGNVLIPCAPSSLPGGFDVLCPHRTSPWTALQL